MSYDLTLFRCPPGVAPETAVEHLEDDNAPGDTMEQMEEIAAWMRSRIPALARSTAQNVAFIELDQPELEVQVIISSKSIGITVPYFRENAREMLKCVKLCVQALSEKGFTAWDPQLGRVVTPDDLDRMVHQYREVDPIVLQIRKKPKKPWWKVW